MTYQDGCDAYLSTQHTLQTGFGASSFANSGQLAKTFSAGGIGLYAHGTSFSPWGYGNCRPSRAGMRSELCLAGYDWHIADKEAASLIATAITILGTFGPAGMKARGNMQHHVKTVLGVVLKFPTS